MRLIALPAIFCLGAIASRTILAHSPSPLATDLSQALVVATTWGRFGMLVWAILAATLALAFVPYLGSLAQEAPSRTKTLISVALSLAAGFAWAPLFSSDVYAYAAYGEMARTGLNPYAHLVAPSTDPLLAAAQWQWGGAFPLCVYGSAFVALAQFVVTLSGATHVLLALQSLRIASSFALLCCTFSLYSLNPRAAVFFSLNPIVLWSAIEGHNDTIALAVVLLGVVVFRRWSFIGSMLVAIAALVKLPALGASIALASNAILFRARAVPILLGTVVGLALVLAGSLALVRGVSDDLAPHGHYLPLASVQALGIPVAILAALIVLARLRVFTQPLDRWCVFACALWIAIPNPYPWYSLWLLVPCSFAGDARLRATAVALAGASLLRYLPDAASIPAGFAAIGLGLCALAAFIPLML